MNKIIACKIQQWRNCFVILYYRIQKIYFNFRLRRVYKRASKLTMCREQERIDDTDMLIREHE